MVKKLSTQETLDQHDAAVDAFVEVAQRFDAEQWALPACGDWTALQTLHHCLGVIGWYHAWLDRALEGETSKPFDAADIDEHTAASVRDNADVTAEAALARFAELGHIYTARVGEHPDITYAYPYGVVTPALHLRVAAAEWHLHAWDLSTAVGPLHEPEAPDRLMIGAGEVAAANAGGIGGFFIRRAVPRNAVFNAWPKLLARTGRG